MPFSEETKKLAFRRSGGRCECRRKNHGHLFGRCAALLWSRRSAEFHHVNAEAGGGHDGLSNCEVLCPSCHKKTPSYGRRRPSSVLP